MSDGLSAATANSALGTITGGAIYAQLHIGAGAPALPGWVFGYTGFSTAGSGVAVQNPYWMDADVVITGGTVTAISAGLTLGGSGGSATTAPAMTATGLTTGTVKWPGGGWLSITQSASPTVNICLPAV